MIINASDLQVGAELRCDVCVVGSGAAGITVAHELRNSGLDVLLLEAGGTKVSSREQDVYAGEVVDPQHHGALHLYRHRRFGGTTPVWGGRCAPFDDIDYECRSHVPYSGWPLNRQVLDRYCARAHDYLETGAYCYSADADDQLRRKQFLPGFHANGVNTDFIWRFSLPTNFAKEFGNSLAKSGKVRVCLHGNCLKLHVSPDAKAIDHLEAASSPGRRFTVRARTYVLATGGLEVARILLASNDVAREGIGNDHGLVGRFYISHITGDAGEVRFTPKGGQLIWDYERTAEGVYCRRAFAISPEVQRAENLLNFRAILSHPFIADPRHGNGILSAMYMVKRFLAHRVPPEYSKALSSMKPVERATGHARNIALGAGQLARFSHTFITQRVLARRKLPSVTVYSQSDTYTLHFDGEQSPNPDSRVTLCDQRDAYGIPRLRVDWRYQERDVDSIVRSCELIAEALDKSGTGQALYDSESVRQQAHKSGVGSHHIGTTRMASDASRGVVDEHCRVFGVDNLFIASSSVFPTSSFANPTLMIVAMAVKIADEIAQRSRTP